jgi:nicotinamidase-related amidase
VPEVTVDLRSYGSAKTSGNKRKHMDSYIQSNTLEKKCREWLARIKDYNIHKMQAKPNATALLVIDMQRFFLTEGSKTFCRAGLEVVPNIKRILQAFRERGLPVIFTRHCHHPSGIDAGIMGWWWEGRCIEGTQESEVVEELAPLPNEKQVLKHRYSAFYGTDLETILRVMKVADLVIAGIMTNLCCETTARDAYMRDYHVFFLADATATLTEEMHLASLLNLALGFAYVTTTDEVIGMLKK